MTATLLSHSCGARNNQVVITAPVTQTVFADGCFDATGVGVSHQWRRTLRRRHGAPGRGPVGHRRRSSSLAFAPTIRVTGDFANGWTLTFDDGSRRCRRARLQRPRDPDQGDAVVHPAPRGAGSRRSRPGARPERCQVEIRAADHQQHLLVRGAARRRRSSAPPAAAPPPARPRGAARFHSASCAARIAASPSRCAAVDVALRDLPGDRADAARAERIGGDAGDLHIDRLAGLACAEQRRRELRLERLDPAAVLEPGRDAGDQAAAADADQHAVGHAGSSSTSAASVPAPITTSRWS